MELNRIPDWWNIKGGRMKIVEGVRGKLRLKGVFLKNREGATVSITPDMKRKLSFWIRFKLPHSGDAETCGRFRADENTIRKMFGIEGEGLSGKIEGRWYVREGDYLNIPRRGSGHDSDPNVSILITPEIQEALSKYLS